MVSKEIEKETPPPLPPPGYLWVSPPLFPIIEQASFPSTGGYKTNCKNKKYGAYYERWASISLRRRRAPYANWYWGGNTLCNVHVWPTLSSTESCCCCLIPRRMKQKVLRNERKNDLRGQQKNEPFSNFLAYIERKWLCQQGTQTLEDKVQRERNGSEWSSSNNNKQEATDSAINSIPHFPRISLYLSISPPFSVFCFVFFYLTITLLSPFFFFLIICLWRESVFHEGEIILVVTCSITNSFWYCGIHTPPHIDGWMNIQ